MRVKRYVVFAYEQYYPGGGWCDYRGSFDTQEEARAQSNVSQIVDLETGDVVFGEQP